MVSLQFQDTTRQILEHVQEDMHTNDTIQNRENKYLREPRKARTTADTSFF